MSQIANPQVKPAVKTMNVLEGSPEVNAKQVSGIAGNIKVKGGKVKPTKGQDMRKALADAQARIAALETALEAKGEAKDESQPVSPEEFAKACETIRGEHKRNALEASRSLAKVLKFTPALTDDQRKEWRKVRKECESLHSAAVRQHKGEVQGLIRKAWNTPAALLGFRKNQRKTDNAVTGLTFKAKNLAKALPRVKGKGKGAAKPEQVAANMPKADNANPPAKV